MPDLDEHGPPPLAVGHLSLAVANVDTSHRFYVDLGLRSFLNDDEIAILELRGGTHLLLFPREAGATASGAGELDLMIAGKTRDDLETFHSSLVEKGLAVGAIPDKSRHGHYRFQIRDPDGNAVTVHTSHAGSLPV